MDGNQPAFPLVKVHADGTKTLYRGMTLRQYYKGQAIGAWIRIFADRDYHDKDAAVKAAKLAAITAEAMLDDKLEADTIAEPPEPIDVSEEALLDGLRR
ncbi:MAG: hypothetical protein WC683_04235 [bacterium]